MPDDNRDPHPLQAHADFLPRRARLRRRRAHLRLLALRHLTAGTASPAAVERLLRELDRREAVEEARA